MCGPGILEKKVFPENRCTQLYWMKRSGGEGVLGAFKKVVLMELGGMKVKFQSKMVQIANVEVHVLCLKWLRAYTLY